MTTWDDPQYFSKTDVGFFLLSTSAIKWFSFNRHESSSLSNNIYNLCQQAIFSCQVESSCVNLFRLII